MSQELLEELMTTVGEPSAGKHVEFVGKDPVLPLPLKVGDVAAAVIGGIGVQAARIHEMRTGRMQDVRVEVDKAAASLMGQRFIRPDTAPGEEPTSFLGQRTQARTGMGSRIIPAKDGRWMFLHREFAHHRERQDAFFKSDGSEESIKAAVAQWDAFELEDKIFEIGACGGAVRSYEEWDQHPQAKILDRQPIVEIIKIGDSPAEPLPAGTRPLEGVRVLDLTRVIAGPTTARTLAEYGADVLRIANDKLDDNHVQRMETGHGKRSTVLDIVSPDGRAALTSLIKGADVFSQSYRPGSFEKHGYGPEDLAKIRPGIVYVTISAWSHEGDWNQRRGFESVVQSVSGVALDYHLNGQPRLMPANAIDYGTGYLGAFGALVALSRRQREGGSYLVRVSLARTGRWITAQPHVSPEERAAIPDLPQERLEQMLLTGETPFGRIRYIGPVAHMSETPTYWDKPTVPGDYNQPEWLERSW